MEITIKATPEEAAALVVAIQERRSDDTEYKGITYAHLASSSDYKRPISERLAKSSGAIQ